MVNTEQEIGRINTERYYNILNIVVNTEQRSESEAGNTIITY